MSEGRLEKSPTASSLHKPVESSSQSSLTYPVRRMRNTAVLVKWIEEHQNNPYPTKAEKQYLAYYSGMNLTQLSTWFANARRRIKKIGMKTWLEGRSTFTVDFFPTPRPAESYGVAGKQSLQSVRCKIRAFLLASTHAGSYVLICLGVCLHTSGRACASKGIIAYFAFKVVHTTI